MEQRPLRLGDIVDDYCPRERRITNHAIVAIVENAIRQTRCSTCDAEHVYKEARMPRRRQTDPPVSDRPGLAAKGGASAAESAESAESIKTAASASGETPEAEAPMPLAASEPEPEPEPVAVNASGSDEASATSGTSDEEPVEDAWISHRRLIRATLPRTENDVPAPRPIPEFTMHQRQTRGSHAFRNQGNGPVRGGGGSGQGRGGFRHGRPGHEPNGNGPAHGNGNGSGHGSGTGHGSGQPPGGGRSRRGRHRGSNKRSR